MVPFRFNPVPLEAAGNGGPRQMVTPVAWPRPGGGEQNPAYVLLSTIWACIPACGRARSRAPARGFYAQAGGKGRDFVAATALLNINVVHANAGVLNQDFMVTRVGTVLGLVAQHLRAALLIK
jgi:hypothetical protein